MTASPRLSKVADFYEKSASNNEVIEGMDLFIQQGFWNNQANNLHVHFIESALLAEPIFAEGKGRRTFCQKTNNNAIIDNREIENPDKNVTFEKTFITDTSNALILRLRPRLTLAPAIFIDSSSVMVTGLG